MFWLPFEQDLVSLSHSFLYLELQVPRFEYDLLSMADWAFLFTCMSISITLFAFHLDLFNCVFDFYFPDHLSTATACLACMKNSWDISCAFAMPAYLAPSETVQCLSTFVEHWQRNAHLCPEISSFWFGSFLDLCESLLSIQIVGVSFWHVDQHFVRSFYLQISLLQSLIISIPVWMVFYWKSAKCLLYLVTVRFSSHLEQII